MVGEEYAAMSTDGARQWDEALLREQYQTLARLIPVLYAVVIATTASICLAFYATAPAWLVMWILAAVLVIVCLRLRYWLSVRAIAARQEIQIMRRDIRGTLILGPLIALVFAGVGICLIFYANPVQQSLAAVAIWVAATACAFCLAALPAASIPVVLAAAMPLAVTFLLSGNDMLRALACVVILISFLVIYMLVQNYRSFEDMVASRCEIETRHRQAEQAKEAATLLAHTDYLTNLSNRRHFELLLNARVSDPDLRETSFVVGIVDLDGFKPINDVHGHGVGDDVLVQVADRLAKAMVGHGRAARIGGDEFAVLLEGASTEAEALAFASTLQQVLAEPYAIGQGLFAEFGCSIGFALYPASSADPARLIDHADMALYRAKAQGRGTAIVFSPDQENSALERAQIEQALRRAIATSAFSVHFQPIVDLATGVLAGFEALARWRDPQLGPVSPAVFIPIAERVGLIEAITDDLLRKAARIAAQWPDRLTLSFNLSADQLVKESAGLRIITILAECGLPPHRFEAEITETALMKDLPAARRTIENLKAAGIRVALDDFGTGYSSLSQIRDLPLDKVKIDKSFVDQICLDLKMRNLVRTIITMCEALDLRCVAEGIERKEQLDALRLSGCYAGQGYLFARPMAAEDMATLIEAHPARPFAAGPHAA